MVMWQPLHALEPAKEPGIVALPGWSSWRVGAATAVLVKLKSAPATTLILKNRANANKMVFLRRGKFLVIVLLLPMGRFPYMYRQNISGFSLFHYRCRVSIR